MENFKINNYENQDNGFEEFQTLSLEYLNHEIEFSPEQKHEIEQNHEKSKIENYEAVMDIFEKNQESGREISNIFDGAREAREEFSTSFYMEEYGANFERFGGREDYQIRPNLEKTQEELSKEITAAKAQVRNSNFSQKMATFGQALGFRRSA